MTRLLIRCSLLALVAILAVQLSAQEPPKSGFADAVLGRWDLTVQGANGPYPSWVHVHLRKETELQGRFGRLRQVGASDQRADSRDQLVRAERLGDVVVGPELETHDAVSLFTFRGEHDDGYGCRGSVTAQRAAHFEATEPGQHQIEKDEIDGVPARVRERFVACPDDVAVPAGLAQIVTDQIGDVAIVFGDQDTHAVMAGT